MWVKQEIIKVNFSCFSFTFLTRLLGSVNCMRGSLDIGLGRALKGTGVKMAWAGSCLPWRWSALLGGGEGFIRYPSTQQAFTEGLPCASCQAKRRRRIGEGRINSICAQALCIRRLAQGQTCLLSTLCLPTKLGVWVGWPHPEEGVPTFHSNTDVFSLQAISLGGCFHPSRCLEQEPLWASAALSPCSLRWTRSPGHLHGFWSPVPVALTLCPDPDPWRASLSLTHQA